MRLILGIVVVTLAALFGMALSIRRRRARAFLESHSIDAEQLHDLLFAKDGFRAIQVFDVRQPLDLLAYSQIIPGARRLSPKEILANPQLIPKDEDTIVYCTCPSDKTARKILYQAASLGFDRVRILSGGLDAWKNRRYPIKEYETAFQLDTLV